MAPRHPGWVNGIDANEARLATGTLAAAGPAPTQSRSGLKPGPGAPGQVSVNANALHVNPFQGVIQDGDTATGGPYLVTVDAPVDLPVVAGDQTSPRIDLVYALLVNEGSAGTSCQVKLLQGKPDPNPQAPEPSTKNVLKLATVVMPAGATQPGGIVDLRQWTGASGGILTVPSGAPQPAPYAGLFTYDPIGNALAVNNGTAWQTVWQGSWVDTGWVPCTIADGWVAFPEAGTPAPQVRRIGNVVHLYAVLSRTGPGPSNPPGDGQLALGLPGGFAPPYTHRWPVGFGSGNDFRMTQGRAQNGSVMIDGLVPGIPTNFWVVLSTQWLQG